MRLFNNIRNEYNYVLFIQNKMTIDQSDSEKQIYEIDSTEYYKPYDEQKVLTKKKLLNKLDIDNENFEGVKDRKNIFNKFVDEGFIFLIYDMREEKWIIKCSDLDNKRDRQSLYELLRLGFKGKLKIIFNNGGGLMDEIFTVTSKIKIIDKSGTVTDSDFTNQRMSILESKRFVNKEKDLNMIMGL